MDASTFELAVSMPREARFAEAVRRLTLQSAQYAGCAAGHADPFAASVEEAFLGCLAGGAAPAPDHGVPLVFRRASGPLEVIVDGRMLTLTV
jgi:hypothetical protein